MRWIVLIALLLSTNLARAQSRVREELSEQDRDDRVQLDAVIKGCMELPETQRDEICKFLVTFRNVGEDAIEALKEYANLTPAQYAALTLANSLANRRLRIKTKSTYFKDTDNIYDFQEDSVLLGIEKRF